MASSPSNAAYAQLDDAAANDRNALRKRGAKGKKVWLPLPDVGFDTTEAAVGWWVLHNAGIEVVFATEKGPAGPVAQCDPKLLTGVIFAQLGAEAHPKECYKQMISTESFRHPVAWGNLNVEEFDGLYLTGGHEPRMRQYLGSETLHQKCAQFWLLDRPVAAVCHGPIVLARSINPQTGKSVLYDKRSSALPKHLERNAFCLTCCCLGKYYRTYPEYVEDEMRSVMRNPDQFVPGPRGLFPPKKGTTDTDFDAMVVSDGKYVSARWPGDVYLLARKFVELLEN